AVNEVRAAIPRLAERMPDDVKLNVIFDQSSYVRNSIAGLRNAGLGGLLLVVLVLILFLGNIRTAFIVAISLPLSVLFTFIVLYFSGQAINSITLGGIALVLGLLVDNSIVVLESIEKKKSQGQAILTAAKDAAMEVSMPVLASTLVIVAVFIPVMFLSGIAKFLFSPLAITVAAAMMGSYIFSLTLIPVLASLLLKDDQKGDKRLFKGFHRFIENMGGRYERLLKRALDSRALILICTVLLFAGSLFLMSNSGYELFPESDVGQMEIQVRTESGTPLELTQEVIIEMEQVVREETQGDLEQVISNIGVFYDLPAAYTPNSGVQDAFIGVQLKESHIVSTKEYARRIRRRFTEMFPGVETSFNTGGLITAALNEGKPSPIDVQIKGNKLDVLRSLAEQIRDTIRTLPTTRDVRVLQRLDAPAKDIDIDRIKAAELGVKPVDAIKNMVSALNSSTTFEKAFWIDENNGNHYYVGVTYPEDRIDDIDVLSNVTTTSATHDKPIPFRSFSKITDSSNPVEINHHNLSRVFNVYANIDGSDVGSVSDNIKDIIKSIDVPKGYTIEFEGEVNVISKSFKELTLGLVLAAILAFLILVPLFRSFRQPLIIILTIPLGFIGVALLMWITNTNLNIQSMMGIIMMIGIAVSYGNILVDRINTLFKGSQSLDDAIVQGSRDRFRPVLMTAITTILGLMPTAIGMGQGTEANVPLAIAVIGGTFMATLLTLFIIPILYSLFTKSKTSISND
ncbi:MAG: multidrug efflux pump subunit AcrB, partial [Saprospiraceae bacterium]